MSETEVSILLAVFFVLTVLCEIARGVYSSPKARVELLPNFAASVNYFLLSSAHFAGVVFLLSFLLPGLQGACAALPMVPLALGALLVDDYLAYWGHRLSHQIPWFWRLHKPHHAVEHLNASATLSGNILYLHILPSSLTIPVLVYLGAPGPALFLLAFKFLIGINQHSDLRWDLSLRRWTPTRWLMNGLEQMLVLQDFHHAHHGIGRDGHSAGNFGSGFPFWDRLHGTGRQPHAQQARFGLPDGVTIEPWHVRVWWPIFRTKERADLRVPTEESVRYSSMEIADASAVIFTFDERAIPVHSPRP
ncbi:Fatty acid hydroxylase superfamily protein [compost metagenome]